MKKAYRVIIEKTQTGFSAYAPDLPGCMATGKDKNETLQKMKEAMQLHVKGLQSDDDDLP